MPHAPRLVDPPITDACSLDSRADRNLVVLDSNVVLEWLHFGDARMARLADAIERGILQWVTGAAMREELVHVLARGIASAKSLAPEVLWSTWRRLCTEHPATDGPVHSLHCTDRDDQKFLDFAVAYRVGWLVTRDRALLKLARRARAYGLAIVTPERWTPAAAIDEAEVPRSGD